MSGIAGFCRYGATFEFESFARQLADNMAKSINHRGKINHCIFFDNAALIENSNYEEPITTITYDGINYSIVFDGEIYNLNELTSQYLKELNKNAPVSEAVLLMFAKLGDKIFAEINGIFSIAIYNRTNKVLTLAIDKFGAKPLFYTVLENTLIFGSEIKALLKYPNIKAEIDKEGLAEIFAISPARTEGYGVFCNFFEVKPSSVVTYAQGKAAPKKYWLLKAMPHTDSYQSTIEKTAFLLEDAVKRQLTNTKSLCSLLSGGLDSSIVTAIAVKHLKDTKLSTYSFDYVDNDKFFQSNSFQPDMDRPFVDKMVSELDVNHSYLFCDSENLVELLNDSVIARDLPGMTDVDSSLMYFLKEVAKNHSLALTGECSDEIFCGYPWFHREELLYADTFPWTKNTETRRLLLSDDLLCTINIDSHIKKRYEASLADVHFLDGESVRERRLREIFYLNTKWFMRTLLDRMDRIGAMAGVSGRVPFADFRLVEYLYNAPWEMKSKDGVVKNLLREASKQFLTDEIRMRKKSPFPKTYNPTYTKLVSDRLENILNDPSSPIHPLINKQKALELISSPANLTSPWFGQLMAGPQLIAYYCQIDFWLKEYNVSII